MAKTNYLDMFGNADKAKQAASTLNTAADITPATPEAPATDPAPEEPEAPADPAPEAPEAPADPNKHGKRKYKVVAREKSTARVDIRLKPSEVEELYQVADSLGLSVARTVVYLVKQEAKRQAREEL